MDPHVLSDASLKKTVNSGKKITVTVEGNVGCGKTTFLEYCQQFKDTETLMEPVGRWRDLDGDNLLELMYKDPRRWGLTFQTYVQLTMLKLHLIPSSAPVKMMERSIHSARYVFIENLYNKGFMQPTEYRILDEWYQHLLESAPVSIDLIVYLRTDPEVALERIKLRKRQEEVEMPLDYLKTLHELHDNWLLGKSKFPLPAKVLVIDANRKLPDLQREFDRHIPDLILNAQGMAPPTLVPPLQSNS
ncbi:thymidine kinase 2, mitochondrial-like isoform X2 [Ornithodoros turicata]|uniref:thymidine kinase 2, mitochondrial-like isoform X2 n=1 Tax=Ornithodoros turicata TaxID=34597 RepID=UPI00313A36D7